MFNDYLDGRVRGATWDRILPGDKANLDGTGSVFDVDDVDKEIERRCSEMDIHPAGELAGDGSTGSNDAWIVALGKARVEPGTRSLRLNVGDLSCNIVEDAVELSFALGRGAFATSVLRELANTNATGGTSA
jgi:tRNA pseudouridine13 synthase